MTDQIGIPGKSVAGLDITFIDPEDPPEDLGVVDVLYTDLDGTLFAPGGTIMRDDAGDPSSKAADLMVALREAGVEIVPVTGRNRVQVREIAHVLGADTFIGELGGFTCYGRGLSAQTVFHTGEWADVLAGRTPVETMEQAGIIEHLLALYPADLERNPLDITNMREVSVLMLGLIDVEQAAAQISTPELPITIIDNGKVHPLRMNIPLADGIHIYHVIPRGISKGAAIADDMARRGIEPDHALAIGDSCGDLSMADACRFVLVENGTQAPEVMADVERRLGKKNGLAEDRHGHGARGAQDIRAIRGHRIDGWCNLARALLVARGRRDADTCKGA